jgi:serine/threonine-protein kinase
MACLCVMSAAIEFTIGDHNLPLLAVMFAMCRVDGVETTLLLRLGLAYEVVVCLAVSMGFNWLGFNEYGEAPLITWSSIWIVVFPFIIPSRPSITMVAALIAAATSPLSVFFLQQVGSVHPVPYDYFLATVSPLLCVVIAVATSRVMYGLNLDVAKARQLGSYQLVELLGKGGMGDVWLARHTMLARPAAIKLISTRTLAGGDVKSEEALVKRFEREAQATAMLQSEHTVAVYDFGVTEDGLFYYAMELLDGHDLDDLVKRFGPVPPERALYILQQVCHSLAEAHHDGLVHRDIKPANIFLCRKGLDCDYAKVLDFGLVKSVIRDPDRTGGLTIQGNIAGTPAFIAPEIALGKETIDGRADLYALGCVAYWLLTGQLVFEADTPMGIVLEHVKAEPVPLSALVEGEVPRALEDAVHACLEKDPAARPQSAMELCERLTAVECANPWTQPRAERWWDAHLPRPTA